MCGIVGYTGGKYCPEVLVDGLRRLEYRGYDSAGIAVFRDGAISVIKAKGRLSELEKRLGSVGLDGSEEIRCGIGHTRWATHGEPSDVNSHPHASGDKIAVVHNGIIENYIQLRTFLISKGYVFLSETDSEVVSHLLHYLYDGDMTAAVAGLARRLRGSYALCIICSDTPGTLYAVRRDNPLIVGVGNGENLVVSDIPAILRYTRDYYLLSENEVAVIRPDGVEFFSEELEPIKKELLRASWDIEAVEKGGYQHFMLKEIMETPKVLRDATRTRLQNGMIDFSADGIYEDYFKNIERIHVLACGSAMHVGYAAKYIVERLARIPVEVEAASEFRYKNPIIGKNDLALVISQSGETADTLAALRLAKSQGMSTLAVVNVVASSIAREADRVLYTWAGPEIAVATTKAYSAQLVIVEMLAVYLAKMKGTLADGEVAAYTAEIARLPELAEQSLLCAETCQQLAAKFQSARDLFFIGRGLDYAISIEGSLKLKEISYIHSEAYPAGELKHGTISLIVDGVPVIAIATQTGLTEKLISNIREVGARKAQVITLCAEDCEAVGDYFIRIPKTLDLLMGTVAALPLQLFAYYIAALRGCDVDKPRNLAKSVTVE